MYRHARSALGSGILFVSFGGLISAAFRLTYNVVDQTIWAVCGIWAGSRLVAV